MTTLGALAAMILFVAALRLYHSFWVARLRRPRWPDEIHFAETDDGWRLALHRYRAAVTKSRPPVLLVHGIGADHRNMDLDDESSLARALHAAGHDVWQLDQRGCGASAHPDERRARRDGWTFDDILHGDIPAALRRVRDATGATSVDWVGFSMGGLLAYAYLGNQERTRDTNSAQDLPAIRRLVTIGSPVSARPAGSLGMLGALARLLRPLRSYPTRTLSRAFAWVAPFVNRVSGGVVAFPGSTPSDRLRAASMLVVADMSRPLVQQLLRWMREARFDSVDGAVDYAAGLESIRVPTLVVGGLRDRVASRGAIRHAHEQLGAEEKRLLLIGTEAGATADYGHADLAFGRHAPEEVFAPVVGWLALSSPPSSHAEDGSPS